MGDIFTIIPAQTTSLIGCLQVQLAESLARKNIALSNSKIRRLIFAGCVRCNGTVEMRPGRSVTGQDTLAVFIDREKVGTEKQPADAAFTLTAADILFEDEALIIVNKPENFPTEQTITGNRNNMHDEAVNYLWKKVPELKHPPYVGIMHRLDRTTSGVLLFTKTRTANGPLHEQFERHTVQKTYRALCTQTKKLPPRVFSVESYLARISPKSQAAKWGSVAPRCGQFAHTDAVILGSGQIKKNPVVALEVRPKTGRTHQIRVHLAESGLPIVGDDLYGGMKYPRILLHAESLIFTHPISGERIAVTAPVPRIFDRYR